MCIFNKAVERVHGTKILVGSTTDGRQLTVYTNTIAFGNTDPSDDLLLAPSLLPPSASSSTLTVPPSDNAMILYV